MAYYTDIPSCICPGVSCVPVYEPTPPPHYSRKFSPSTARWCLGLVVNLYTSVYEGKPLQDVPGAKLVRLFSFTAIPGSDNIAALYMVKKSAYLIFRGTIGQVELGYDLDLAQIPFGDERGPPSCVNGEEVLVHRGFATLYRDFADSVRMTLASLKFEHLVIAGHSLGAALATLAAYDLSPAYRLQTYSYGSFRVGNMAFATVMEERVPCRFYNIQNEDDLIVHFPPSVISASAPLPLEYPLPVVEGVFGDIYYEHVGRVYLFRENWLSYSTNHSFNIYLKNLKSSRNVVMIGDPR